MQTLPFQQSLYLKIEERSPGVFELLAINEEQLILPPEIWISKLYFKHEPSFYGLHISTNERHIIVSAAELLDLLGSRYKNPFLTIRGATDTSQELLLALTQAAHVWEQPDLWEHVSVTGDEQPKLIFSGEAVDSTQSALLTTAIEQMLHKSGLVTDDIEALLPFFRNGGWPLQQERTAGEVKMAFRLTEPEENEEEWLLETVLLSGNGNKHWTPAKVKRQLPIEMALPEKWRHLTAEIESLQSQMLHLLSSTSKLLDVTSFVHVHLNEIEVRHFLQYDLAKIQSLGFEIMLPAWLKELKQSKMKVRVSAGQTSSRTTAGMDDILTFKWQFSMNGEQITAEQFKKMVEEKRNFIRIGTEWFQIDANWLNEMRQLMEQAEEENWTVRDLLFKELPETLTETLEDEDDAERDDPMFAFEMQQSLQKFVEQLQLKEGLPAVAVPSGLQAELRPYQQQGFEWLVFMREQKFGACLADDMGLGKTIQLITYMLYTVETLKAETPTIVICPTSVLGNWQKELERFAPSLKVYTHYSGNRIKTEALLSVLREERPHVVLTTYGTVSNDAELLAKMPFASIVLDEAQNIKNMQTLQSRAIRKLNGQHHIALTGTPVENRLSELWAIFDFIHKGYLGSFGKFSENYIVPVERDDSEKHKQILRAKIQPFLLRRTKRDPELMLNLPEKQETQEFCPLTVEQAALYEGFIQDTMADIDQLSGFEKKGRILKMLNKLKQLCNHPALYLKEPFDDAKSMLERSVKLKNIVELAAGIVQNGEQCLIFTQYIGMGELIQHCFNELYDIDVPFLTGSMSKRQRDQLVEAFQAGEFPIFILSLKAGGTGLNLTAANHVLHADRWWNPAVENQATDRAYRIGQTQFVQVHKFITIGTVEEKIDKMISMKSALSDELIQSSKWITELDDKELSDLLSLDPAFVK